ncbi:hypothetical protein FHR71_005410 [Methylobacterium sp. RAS18]|nr:hypothetical protein [Methylobacterium sp. RAS18]
MPSLNTIRTVSVRYQSEGADRFRTDADAAAAAQGNLAQATEQAATVTEQSARRQLSAATAYDRVRASVDANYRSQLAMERATRTVDRALQQGVIDGSAYERTLAQIQARFATTTAAADRMAAAWRNLGAAGEANSRLLTPAGRLGNLSSDGSVQFRPGMGPAANQNISGRRLRSDEVTNLTYQGGDIVAQLGSGSPLSMIALQQGPQIAQIFAGPGGASVKGAFAQATEAVGGFLGKIGPVGIAFGGFTAIAATGAAALLSYSRAQDEAQKSLGALGRVAGVSMGSVNALADAQARLGGLSRREARGIAAGYGGTGQIGSEIIGGLLASTRDYARITGQQLPDAAKEFGAAFADPARGAEALNERLAILNATQLETIRRLDMQGDRLGAQRALLSAYRDGVRGIADETSAWGRMMTTVGDTISNVWDRAGRTIEKSLGGGTLEQKLAAATRRLKELEALGPSGALSEADQIYNIGGSRDDETERVRRYVRGLQEEAQKERGATAKAQQNRASIEVDQIVRGLSPVTAALRDMESKAANINSKLATLPLDESRRARDALAGMERSTELIRGNLKAGGEQFAASLKQAQFDSSMVGLTDRGRSAAQIDFEFKNRAEQALRDGTASEQNARLQSLELERTTRLQTLDRQSSLDLNQSGGAFSRASATLQAQILEASRRFPTVDAAMLAGVLEKEGGFWNTGPTRVLGRDGRPATTAWGRGQITDAAEKDIRRLPGMESFDKYNVETQVMGAAAYLSQRLQWVNGDKIKALDGYGTGPGYGLDVMRRAGQLGDTSSLALARDQDANNRAVQQANDNLKNVTDNYGRNAVALEANGRAQDQYRQLIERGVPAATAASIAFDGMQTKIASLGQTARFIQFQRDDNFARDQLGRTQIEQQAFAAARPYAGTEFEGRVRDRALETATLYESKVAVTDAMSGFVTDLRRGTDAANAFGNMLGRLADRAINGLTDTLVSSLFSAGTKGSSFLGGIGSMFGFANGGIMTSAGPLPLRAYSAGGIADSPQVALYGEGKMPEAYVPLPDGRRIPVAMQGGGAANGNSVTDARQFSFDMRGSTLTEQQARAMFMDALAQSESRQNAALPGRMRDIQRRYG